MKFFFGGGGAGQKIKVAQDLLKHALVLEFLKSNDFCLKIVKKFPDRKTPYRPDKTLRSREAARLKMGSSPLAGFGENWSAGDGSPVWQILELPLNTVNNLTHLWQNFTVDIVGPFQLELVLKDATVKEIRNTYISSCIYHTSQYIFVNKHGITFITK